MQLFQVKYAALNADINYLPKVIQMKASNTCDQKKKKKPVTMFYFFIGKVSVLFPVI